MQTARPIPDFSPRERQLLDLAAEGLTDTAIGQCLGISEATVGTYWGRVRIKLGPYSRTELVAIVMRAEREAAVAELRLENEQVVRDLHASVLAGDVDFYRTLLDAAPDAMILVTKDGLLAHANRAAGELFGYEPEEMLGMELLDLVPERFRTKHKEHREEYVTDPKRREMGEHLETPALRKDGTEFKIRAALSAITAPEGLMVTCMIRAV